MKIFFLLVANLLSKLWFLVPSYFRINIITGLFILESRQSKASEGLKKLFLLKDQLEWVINERAMVYGSGTHPKHKLTNYHNFFIQNIKNGNSVLDVGCGYGAVSKSIAEYHLKSKVTGIDLNLNSLRKAKLNLRNKNVKYIHGDITKQKNIERFDVVILSNVLEHIHDRIFLLKRLKKITRASKFLIRVPLFERDWQIAMRQSLGVNYFSDNDHKIEHTINQFYDEINNSGLRVVKMHTLWGEIWAVCLPKGS